jgi:hypothetical protein
MEPFLEAFDDIIDGMTPQQRQQFTLLLDLYHAGHLGEEKIIRFVNKSCTAARSSAEPASRDGLGHVDVRQCGPHQGKGKQFAGPTLNYDAYDGFYDYPKGKQDNQGKGKQFAGPTVNYDAYDGFDDYRKGKQGKGFKGGKDSKGGKGYQQLNAQHDVGWHYMKGYQSKGWGKPKGKPQGKDGGRGKGSKGKKPSRRFQVPWAESYMEARNALNQWLRLHETFVFRPRPNVPVALQPTWTLLGEEGPNLYKNVRRHCPDGEDGDAIAARIIRRLTNTTHWVADKRNAVELQRQQRRAPTEGTEVTSVVTTLDYSETDV